MAGYTQAQIRMNDVISSRHRYNTRGLNAGPLKQFNADTGATLANYRGTDGGKWLMDTIYSPSTSVRLSDGFGGERNHNGIDLAAAGTNHELHSIASGKVVSIGTSTEKLKLSSTITPRTVGWERASGCFLIIDHGNGVESEYVHLAEPPKFKKNAKISAGQVIGIQGNTGITKGATGIHLHFIIKIDGKKVDPLSKQTEEEIRSRFSNSSSGTNTSTTDEDKKWDITGSDEIDGYAKGKLNSNQIERLREGNRWSAKEKLDNHHVTIKINGLGGMSVPYEIDIQNIARKYDIDVDIFRALIARESHYDAHAISPRGAVGLTQLMPGTAAGLGVTNSKSYKQALHGGAMYLKSQLNTFDGNYQLVLAAYNAGPGAVRKYNGIPPYKETQAYVPYILQKAGKPKNWTGK